MTIQDTVQRQDTAQRFLFEIADIHSGCVGRSSSLVRLAFDGGNVSGFLLQALPTTVEKVGKAHEERWSYLPFLARSLTDAELFSVDTRQLLHRLFHEEDIRLFDAETVSCHCTCSPWAHGDCAGNRQKSQTTVPAPVSRGRTATALQAVDHQEPEDILAEQGKINRDCPFCNTRYSFPADEITNLLAPRQTSPRTLHYLPATGSLTEQRGVNNVSH